MDGEDLEVHLYDLSLRRIKQLSNWYWFTGGVNFCHFAHLFTQKEIRQRTVVNTKLMKHQLSWCSSSIKT